jgi:hypothetical protein
MYSYEIITDVFIKNNRCPLIQITLRAHLSVVRKTHVTVVLYDFIGPEFTGGEVLFSIEYSRVRYKCVHIIRRSQSTKRSCDRKHLSCVGYITSQVCGTE